MLELKVKDDRARKPNRLIPTYPLSLFLALLVVEPFSKVTYQLSGASNQVIKRVFDVNLTALRNGSTSVCGFL